MRWSCTETAFLRCFRERGNKTRESQGWPSVGVPFVPVPDPRKRRKEDPLPPRWWATTMEPHDSCFLSRSHSCVRSSFSLFPSEVGRNLPRFNPVDHRVSRSSIVFVACPSLLPSQEEKLLSPPVCPKPKQKKNKKRGEKGVPAMFFFRFFRLDRPRVV